MIRIDKRSFNQAKISELYSPSGKIVQYVLNGVKKANGEIKGREKDDQLAIMLLRNWFFDDAISDYSGEKISAFLLRTDTAAIIKEYATEVCAFIWDKPRDEASKLTEAFLRYQAVAVEAAELREWEDRRKHLSSLLSIEHINAGMFEVKDHLGCPRPLKLEDLNSAVKGNTLFSNKGRILSLRLYSDAQKIVENCLGKLREIFNYEKCFVSRSRHDLLDAIGVPVCPYCNRQFISFYGADHNRYSTADVDHYYNKDRFPFLALSLYNFVPSCQICNSRFKLVTDFYAKPHLNPYSNGFGSNARFEIENIESLMDSDVMPIIGVHVICDDNMTRNAVNTFRIEELYKNHSDYAKEIINKARIYDSSQINEYLNAYSAVFSSKSELYRTIFGNYLEPENQDKRPLSKLTQDLLFDLGIQIEN